MMRMSESLAARVFGKAAIGLSTSAKTNTRKAYPGKDRHFTVETSRFSIAHDTRPVFDRIEIDLPHPVSTNALFMWANGRPIKTPEYRAWIVDAGKTLMGQRLGRMADRYDITIRVTRPDRRQRDIDNLAKAISDLLVRHRIVRDDHLSDRLTIEWRESTEKGVRVILMSTTAVHP